MCSSILSSTVSATFKDSETAKTVLDASCGTWARLAPLDSSNAGHQKERPHIIYEHFFCLVYPEESGRRQKALVCVCVKPKPPHANEETHTEASLKHYIVGKQNEQVSPWFHHGFTISPSCILGQAQEDLKKTRPDRAAALRHLKCLGKEDVRQRCKDDAFSSIKRIDKRHTWHVAYILHIVGRSRYVLVMSASSSIKSPHYFPIPTPKRTPP